MSKNKGNLAENKACEYLISQGFKIVDKNFYAKKLGEIDIIATKNSTYHFCEVKSADNYETAVNNITKSKISKLIRSIQYYLQIKNLNTSYSLDAIIVVNEQITHLENITL